MACSIISTYGRYGGAPLISTQCPVSTRMPRAWASSPISATSRDLPMPGSPATNASLPCPSERVVDKSAQAGPLGVTLDERREPRWTGSGPGAR